MASVYLGSCDRYDPAAIAGHVGAAADALGVTLPRSGGMLLQPSLPWAHPRYAPHARTHPAVLEGIVASIQGAEVTIGAQSLPGFPTRYSFAKAGYDHMARRFGAALVAFEELEFRPASSPGLEESPVVDLPAAWLDSPFKIAAPRLGGSTLLPFAGAHRLLYGLLPPDRQLAEQHRMQELLAGVAAAASPDLIVVDAIQALHRGGELSGEPVDLGLLIIGTDPVAVDLACASAFGIPDDELDFLREHATEAAGVLRFTDVRLVGDVQASLLEERSPRIERIDPRPESADLPTQVMVLRSPNASASGVAGSLREAFSVLARGGVSLAKARESILVVGSVGDVPEPASDTAAIIFMDDTSRAAYKGYTRIVRLTGRTPPVSRILMDVPFVLNVANLRADLGFGFALAGIRGRLSRIFRGPGRPRGAAGRPSAPKGGGDPAPEKG